MGYDSLQHFVKALERAGELVRITEPLSPYLEITEVTDRVCKKGGRPYCLKMCPAMTCRS